MSVLEKYIEKEYSVQVSGVTPAMLTTIGTASDIVFKKNPNRIMYILVNLSANIVYAAYDGAVSATRGIRLNASGGMLNSSIKDDAALTQEELYIVADGAGSAIFGIEVVEVL